MIKSSRKCFINTYLVHILLLLLYTKSNQAGECPHPCTCQDATNLQVNCSRKLLLNPPMTSATTLTLDLSYNALGPILNISFVQMRNLTLIDFSHNAITVLIDCTFNGMLGLKTVRLGWNRLTSIPDGLFTDANKVENLDLSHNLLTELPHNPFKNLPELKTLDVSYNLIGQIKLGPRFQVLRHIQVIDLSHNHIEAVQKDSFEIASEWEASIDRVINLAFCRISSIESGAISKIPHLYDLDISGNSRVTKEMLTQLILELETGARNLNRLSLAYMNLTTIVPFFTQVSELSLKFLNVSFNNINDLPANVFSTIRSLRVLDLSRNKILMFAEGLSDLVNLRVLNISHNVLESFHGNNVAQLSNVHTLDLSHNKLAGSSVNFLPLTKLKYLNVNNNLLASVVLPSNTSNLQFLDYHSNRITQFTGLDDASILESVDVSDNELGTVSSFLFRGSKFIKIANFSENNIETIDHRAFLPHSPLIIDLSHNFMKEIRYSNWVATQKLYLKHNKIGLIDQQAFHGMTGLQDLDLSRNGLLQLHEDLFNDLTSLKHLNLSHNGLNKVQWKHLFHNLDQLETLDLGHNNISHLTESMLLPLTKISTLCLQANHIQTIIPRVFRDVINLKVIDLSNNPFDCVCDMLAFKDWIKRTKIAVLGLYMMNSTAYHCRTPHTRAGVHVLSWKKEEFECNRPMLYLIIVCTIGAFFILVGVIATAVYRFYKNWKLKAEIRRKLKEQEDERKRKAKKIDLIKLSNQEIAEAIKEAVERKRKLSPRKYEVANNYVHRPEHRQGPAGQDKSRRYSDHGEDRVEFGKNKRNVQGERGRSRERNYEKLKMEELAMERKQGKVKYESSPRFTDKYSDKRETGNRVQGEQWQSDHSSIDPFLYDRRVIPVGKFQHPYEEVIREAQLRERDRMFHYKTDPYYRPVVVPTRKNGPYVMSYASTLPSNWDHNEAWIIPQKEVHRYRSRSQDPRMNGYMTVPNGDPSVHRQGREARIRERVRDNSREIFPSYAPDMDERELIHYTRQRRDNPESYHGYQRSQSYNFIPQGHTSRTSNFKRDRAQREYESIEQMSRHRGIGPRAVSQPALATANMTSWL